MTERIAELLLRRSSSEQLRELPALDGFVELREEGFEELARVGEARPFAVAGLNSESERHVGDAVAT